MGIDGRFETVVLTTQWLNEIDKIEHECFTSPWSRAGLESDILQPFSVWFGIAERKTGRLCAFIGAHVFSGEGEIVNLATLPAYRRLGFAETLIKELFDRTPSLERVFLEVRNGNEAARRLYEKLGFSTFGVRKNYYESPVEDAVLMRYERKI